MAVLHPKWLRGDLLAASIPPSWSSDATEFANDLTFACVRIRKGKTSVKYEHREVEDVPVWFLDVSSPLVEDDDTVGPAMAEAAELLATCGRTGDVLTIRTAFVAESGESFAEYVDRIANMPETKDLADLVTWLGVRCAEWRSKVAQLRVEVLERRAELQRAGLPDDFDSSDGDAAAIVSALTKAAPLVEFRARLDRAGADLDAADAALAAAHELLGAKAATLAQAANERLQTTSTWIGIAVALAGFGAVGGLLFNGDKGSGLPFWLKEGDGLPMWLAVLLTVAPAAFALSVFAWLYLRHLRRGKREPRADSVEAIEAELNALCEGSLVRVAEMHRATRPLKERITQPEILEVIQAVESSAQTRLSTVINSLTSKQAKIDSHLFDLPPARETTAAARTAAVSRLDSQARTTETAALVFAEVEVSSAPLPDIAIALWLKGHALGINPDAKVVIEALLYRVVCDDLGGSPLVAARALRELGGVVKSRFAMKAETESPLDEVADAEGELLKRFVESDVGALLEALSVVRLSRLAAMVAAEAAVDAEDALRQSSSGDPTRQVDAIAGVPDGQSAEEAPEA